METGKEFQGEWCLYERVRYVEDKSPMGMRYLDWPDGALIVEGDIRQIYNPVSLAHDIWLRFINIGPEDTTAMAKFARNFGLLGLEGIEAGVGGFYRGEYVRYWSQETVRMKAVAEVWRDLKDGNKGNLEALDRLRDRFRPGPRGSGLVMCLYDKANTPKEFGYPQLENGRVKEVWLSELQSETQENKEYQMVNMGWGWKGVPPTDNPLDVARTFIADEITTRLYKQASPYLGVSKKGLLATFNVFSLLAAMYLQIWKEMASGEIGRLRRCERCRKWFKAKRGNQIYCSDPCGNANRQRRHRLK